MSTLKEYIKSQPKMPMQAWAEKFGTSRPHLIALVEGTRFPSIELAQRISAATDYAVPVTEWPNVKAVIDAVAGERAPQ